MKLLSLMLLIGGESSVGTYCDVVVIVNLSCEAITRGTSITVAFKQLVSFV